MHKGALAATRRAEQCAGLPSGKSKLLQRQDSFRPVAKAQIPDLNCGLSIGMSLVFVVHSGLICRMPIMLQHNKKLLYAYRIGGGLFRIGAPASCRLASVATVVQEERCSIS